MGAMTTPQERPLAIEGARLFALDPVVDDRGAFMEGWREAWAPGFRPVQSNLSWSEENVLRGLHFHRHQADVWNVVSGRARIGLVDLRPGSATHLATSVIEVDTDDRARDRFALWQAGRTGFPIVDAGMRQLLATGWMHNRCRMIVASFLTKDLIIDWRWGEQFFMQHLLDGDLASNNGGWQWSASSGMDSQPLRIFNPASQAQRFDPEGDYIRRWLPELREVDTESLLSGKIPPVLRGTYPAPIVDHHQQQQRQQQQRRRRRR